MTERQAAYSILERVFKDKQYVNDALKRFFATAEPLSRPFVTRLVLTALQNVDLFTYQIERVSKTKRLDQPVFIILLLAQAEIYFLDTPKYAAVNEAVQGIKRIQGIGASKFVNAILRRLLDLPLPSPADFKTPAAYLAVRYSFPAEIVTAWVEQFGEATTTKILTASKVAAPQFVRAREAFIDPDFAIVPEVPGAYRYQGEGAVYDHPLIEKNGLTIQDATCQLIVPQLDLRPGLRVLDLCAAPGTKTWQIADLIGPTGTIVAVDDDPERLRLLEVELARRGLKNIKALCADGRTLTIAAIGQFDRVLLDAPCSGLGVVRRKSDLLLRYRGAKLQALTQLQAELLTAAKALVVPGGMLVYATCTLNKAENEAQIAQFLKLNPEVQLLSSGNLLGIEYQGDHFYYATIRC